VNTLVGRPAGGATLNPDERADFDRVEDELVLL
jgi:hypothetical protein